MSIAETIENNYKDILYIDNDMYIYDPSDNIEDIRRNLIKETLKLLEDNIELCNEGYGKSFMEAIILPTLKN